MKLEYSDETIENTATSLVNDVNKATILNQNPVSEGVSNPSAVVSKIAQSWRLPSAKSQPNKAQMPTHAAGGVIVYPIGML